MAHVVGSGVAYSVTEANADFESRRIRCVGWQGCEVWTNVIVAIFVGGWMMMEVRVCRVGLLVSLCSLHVIKHFSCFENSTRSTGSPMSFRTKTCAVILSSRRDSGNLSGQRYCSDSRSEVKGSSRNWKTLPTAR